MAELSLYTDDSIYKKTVAVTNRHLCNGELLPQIELICKMGVSSVILREKDMTEKEYEALAEKAIAVGNKYNTPIILHSFVKVAEGLNNKAIHLSMPDFVKMKNNKDGHYKDLSSFSIIGVSTHTLEEALEAESMGASYITVSHIYATECKKGLEPKGTDFLKEVCGAVKIPVYALGGIDFENMKEALDSGAKKVCMMSEMMKIKLPCKTHTAI